jgi:hypothetical protein
VSEQVGKLKEDLATVTRQQGEEQETLKSELNKLRRILEEDKQALTAKSGLFDKSTSRLQEVCAQLEAERTKSLDFEAQLSALHDAVGKHESESAALKKTSCDLEMKLLVSEKEVAFIKGQQDKQAQEHILKRQRLNDILNRQCPSISSMQRRCKTDG